MLVGMSFDLNVDELVDRTARGELVWKLAENESGWSAEYGGNVLVLRTADANLEVIEDNQRILVIEKSEAAPAWKSTLSRFRRCPKVPESWLGRYFGMRTESSRRNWTGR